MRRQRNQTTRFQCAPKKSVGPEFTAASITQPRMRAETTSVTPARDDRMPANTSIGHDPASDQRMKAPSRCGGGPSAGRKASMREPRL
jgi:hypothetical protein